MDLTQQRTWREARFGGMLNAAHSEVEDGDRISG